MRRLVMLFAEVLTVASLAVAINGTCLADTIMLVNPSFEGEAGWPKISFGFDNSTYDVAGWKNDYYGYTDTGIDWTLGGLGPHSGGWSAYFYSGDAGALQNTDYTIKAGDQFQLTFWSASGQADGYLKAALQYDTGTNRYDFLSTQAGGSSSWKEYTLSGTAPGAAVGSKLVIDFSGGTAGSGAWPVLDDVSLSVQSIPEPSSVVLLCSAIFGLLCYAWRKRK